MYRTTGILLVNVEYIGILLCCDNISINKLIKNILGIFLHNICITTYIH